MAALSFAAVRVVADLVAAVLMNVVRVSLICSNELKLMIYYLIGKNIFIC